MVSDYSNFLIWFLVVLLDKKIPRVGSQNFIISMSLLLELHQSL